jgi:phosphorylcholine metabolism protein LicD
MNQAIYIGKNEVSTYGAPLDYQYADSFKMNQLVLYLIQNQEELASRFVTDVSEKFANSFMTAINSLDEYEVTYFHNLELFDTSLVDFDELKIELYMAGLGFQSGDSELFFNYPFNLDIYVDGEIIDNSQIEKYREKTVSISFNEDFPMLFETTAQRDKNLSYFKHLFEPIFEGIGLTMRSSFIEIGAHFGISK